jgi:hypothetical protein
VRYYSPGLLTHPLLIIEKLMAWRCSVLPLTHPLLLIEHRERERGKRKEPTYLLPYS